MKKKKYREKYQKNNVSDMVHKKESKTKNKKKKSDKS